MYVCVRCALIAFVLGILGVVFVWPFIQSSWFGSDAGYSADSGYYGGGGGYGAYGGYGGGYGRSGYGTWGGPVYAVTVPAPPRPRIVPAPCYMPCY